MNETQKTEDLSLGNRKWPNPRFNPTLIAFLVLIVAWLVSALLIPGFRTTSHTAQVFQQGAFLGIAAAGQTIVVLVAGIDLSVSGVMTLSSVAASQLLASTSLGPYWSIFLVLGVSAAIGLINGVGVHWLRLHPLIMTLATVTIIQGTLLIYTQGTPPTGMSPVLTNLANGRSLAGIPNALIVWFVISVFTYWLLNRSRFGRQAYAIGTSERVSILSGVSVGNVKLIAYSLSGLFAGISGLLLLGYIGNTYLTLGDPYQLTTIAVVVLGGTSILGGRGNYLGTIAGTLLLIVLLDVLQVLNIAQAGRDVILGVIIVLLLLVYGQEKTQR